MPRTAVVWLALALAPAAAQAGPKVLQAVTCADVENREPVGVARRFPAGTTVHAYLRLRNEAPPTEVELLWFRDGEARGRSTMKVGRSGSWRTWARMRLHVPGRWRIDVHHDGKTIHQLEFTAGPPPGARRASPVAARTPPSKRKRAASKPEPAAHKPKPRRPPPPSARPEGATCRAIVNLRTSSLGANDALDEHVAVDVVVGTRPTGASTPGLVVHDGKRAHALRLVRRDAIEDSPHGPVKRRWDLLVGRAIPNGPKTTWHGYPATLGPGDSAHPGPRDERNLLRLVSVLGPYVGVHASLQGHRPEAFDHSRYATIRAPGRVADPAKLVRDDLPDRARRRLRQLRMRGDHAAALGTHDFRRAAFAFRDGELRLLTLWRPAPNQELLRLDLPVVPPAALRSHLPKPSGVYQAPDDCGRISLRDGRLVAARGALPLRLVRVSAPRARAVLGVTWIPGDDRLDMARAKLLWQQMAHR